MPYEAVIGLEVHVQGRTRSKMFCACPNRYGAEPNTLVCPVCLGYPGVLPVINREAIRQTIVAGLMCGCDIAAHSKFDRKSYFYPDMPKNYQISQYDMPLCSNGGVDIGGTGFSGAPLEPRRIGLTRIHLEEDVAKSTHTGNASAIDFNRAGVPLLEVVSEPDMHTADEAHAYLTALRQIMQVAEVSDCDMEKGQLRCDVNVSVRPAGQAAFGVKIEIKNLNSLRAVHRSLLYEIERQVEVLEDGGTLRQETRRWDDAAGVTAIMRVKEHAHDYRYFPEPDLLPIEITRDWLDKLAAALPESPRARRERLVRDYGITAYDAQVLTLDRDTADYFETAARAGAKPNPKAVANWIMSEVLRELATRSLPISESPLSPVALAELVALIDAGTISGKIAKDVFAEMIASGSGARAVVEARGLVQVKDQGAIDALVRQVVGENPAVVEQVRAGKANAMQFLVGQVMKLSRGKANPPMVVATLKAILDSTAGAE